MTSVLVRRNLSFRNGDHGYDNLVTDSTVFLNNVAARNDHDGISVEDDASHVEVYDSIFWHNGVNGATLSSKSAKRVRELFFADTTGTFKTNFNVICGLGPDSSASGTGSWRRYLVEFPNDTLYASWTNYRHNQPNDDTRSHPEDPVFADSANAAFWLTDTSSVAVDAGTASLAGWTSPWWLSTDVRGWDARDIPGVDHGGDGSPEFGDIGAYEFDAPPGQVQDLRYDLVGSSSVHLLWTTTADDGYSGPTNTTNDLRYAPGAMTEGIWGTATQASGEPAPLSPGSPQGFTVTGLTSCSWYYFGVKFGDVHGYASALGDTTRALTTAQLINGQWVCDEGLRSGQDSGVGLARRGGQAVGALTRVEGRMTGALAARGSPLVVELVPSGMGLDLMLVPLAEADAQGYRQGGGGVLYQSQGGANGWTTQLQYELPEGDSWALVAPERPGRWVFLEPIATQVVLNDLVAGSTRWQIEYARHSRLGDVTGAATTGVQPLELNSGDTLAVHYTGASADGAALPNWLVVLSRPEGGATQNRAGRGETTLPTAFALRQNQPNPFTTTTTFHFDLAQPATVRLEVFDVTGRKVAQLRDAWSPAGRHSNDWDGRDARGVRVQPGTYLYRLTAGSIEARRKLVVLP